MAAESRLLVPVRDSVTLRSTVAHAVRNAVDAPDGDPQPTIHFVFLASWRGGDPGVERRTRSAREVLDRVSVWAEYDLEDRGMQDQIEVRTALLGEEEYLFGATEYAQQLLTYARENDLGRIVLDPEYAPQGTTTLLQPIKFELSRAPIVVEEAPAERPARHQELIRQVTTGRFFAVLGISFVFYLALGDPTYWFDLVTGLATATIVAVALSGVSFTREPSLTESPMRIARGLLYVPVLIYEIIKANIEVAAVILHPRLPIEPRMTRVESFVGSGLPLMTLANSITLTPGTLTVRARDRDLYVHSLLEESREGLFDGGLERWVRFVFYGRAAARIATPEERGDTAVLQGEDADGPLFPEGARTRDRLDRGED